MDNKVEKKSRLGPVYFIIGFILIIGTLAGGNVKYITDWGSAELSEYYEDNPVEVNMRPRLIERVANWLIDVLRGRSMRSV